MKTAPKKAPGKPQAPKKPSTRSKTGNSACSQAASNWQLAIRGKAPLDPDTYKTLGKCRAMSRASKSADDRADMGYNLSEQGRSALKGRLQKRFDEGLITKKSRQDRLKTLLAQRKEKQAQAPATAPAPAPTTKPTDKATPGENKIPESKQVQAMKNKLERMKAQFDNKIEDWSGQTRGHGGTPFIMDNSKGRAQYKRHQKGDESLRNLDKAIKEQEEKIQAAQYRHNRRHTQTKKSEKFIEKNPVSPGLQYLEQKGLVKSWPKKPEVHFVQGLDKTALITVDGRVGVSRGYNGGSTENFLAAKKLASIANSYNRTQSLVSSVRQNPGYGAARAIAAKNRKLVGLKIRDKGFGNSQAGPAPAPAKRENEPPPSPPKPRFEPRKVYATNTQLPSSMGGMKKGYVAEIKGTHPKYKLDRQFLQGRNDGAGTEYTITQRGIYETQTEESKGRAMRTYVFHGRKKTRELLPPGGYSSPTMPSVDRAVNLLELFRKKR